MLGSEEGHPALFFSPFSPRGPAGERVLLLVATAVSSCEASTILEVPLGGSGKKLLWRTKNRAHLDAGCSDDLPPVSVHGAMCMRIGVVGRGVVMW